MTTEPDAPDLAALYATPQITTDTDGRHWRDGTEHDAVTVDGELTYTPKPIDTEFRIGDRVRFTNAEMWPDLVGREGTVVEVPFPKTASVDLDDNPWPGRGLPLAWASDLARTAPKPTDTEEPRP